MIKKHIKLTGTPAYPIVVGSSALIKTENKTIRTSTIQKVTKLTEDDICFETLNSVYHLHINKQSPLAGIMVKHTFSMLGLR